MKSIVTKFFVRYRYYKLAVIYIDNLVNNGAYIFAPDAVYN